MTRRSAPAQHPPPEETDDLSGFPVNGALPDTWFREHARREDDDLGCWWFASHLAGEEPEGRFDLIAPQGTCYVGESRGVAVRERCGRFLAARLPIPVTHVTGRVVSQVTLSSRLGRVADLTSPAAATFGVTGELATGSDYALSATWAQRLVAEFESMLYQPRFTPGQERALALFGVEGAQPGWAPIATVVELADVVGDLGYRLGEIPSSAGIDVDDDAQPDVRRPEGADRYRSDSG